MYEELFMKRLSSLRLQKGVSAREMSLALGQNPGYINNIESGRAFPSMAGFFYICEYFQISPKEFFDDGNCAPEKLQNLVELLQHMSPSKIASITAIVKEMGK